jgi:Zn-dependent protease/CBS domain-containing protein
MDGVMFILLIFACVLLHELGHALMARRFGVRTPDITLLPIGGVARLERIPEEPKQELLIAIAGPLVNVLIATGLILFLRQRAALSDLGELSSPRVAMLAKLASINIGLVLFNLIPAFPMDGGRILRALLAMRMDYAAATQMGARLGQGLALVFALLGLFFNPILLFIAIFVYLGASQEATLAQMKAITTGLPVAEAMVTQFSSLPAGATLDEAVQSLLHTSQREFPVLDQDERLLGIVTREQLLSALRTRGGDVEITEVMHGNVPVLRPNDGLDQAFKKMQQAGEPALPVVDNDGRLIGLLTPENVGHMMMIRSLNSKKGKPYWRPAHA